MVNPVVPSQRTGVNTRLGSLEANINTRKLQQLNFNDPMLNMLTQIHSTTGAAKEGSQSGCGEVRSTLYGFKSRKPSCLQYPAREVTEDKSDE